MTLPEQIVHPSLSNRYREEQIAGLTPIQLLLKIYDAGIANCARKDRERVSRTLIELIAALNFAHRDMAAGLFRLYDYCLRQTKKGDFDGVKAILCDLRDTWSQAEEIEDLQPVQIAASRMG